jgi:hypothetical protein
VTQLEDFISANLKSITFETLGKTQVEELMERIETWMLEDFDWVDGSDDGMDHSYLDNTLESVKNVRGALDEIIDAHADQ